VYQVAIDLPGKVFLGAAEPGEELEAAGVGQGAECGVERHIGSWLSG